MARIPIKDHPRCERCGEPLRPLYYLPVKNSTKFRAKAPDKKTFWYCIFHKRIQAG